MVRDDVQGFQVHADAAFLRQPGAVPQGIEHGAELDRVTQLRIGVQHHAALTQTVGVDGEGPGAHPLGGIHGTAQKGQIVLFLSGVHQGECGVAVEAGNADARLPGGGPEGVQVLVLPAPEFHKGKAVRLGGSEALQEGQLGIQGFNAGTFLQRHDSSSRISPRSGRRCRCRWR